jgi:hypothetical protein
VSERRARGDIILDRRQASRTPIRFDVQCALGGTSFEATCRNLTLHGIFVETEEAVPCGASLELALLLPDDEGAPAKVTVEVRRPARRRGEPLGFGADFVALDDHTARRIRAVLEVTRQRATGGG